MPSCTLAAAGVQCTSSSDQVQTSKLSEDSWNIGVEFKVPVSVVGAVVGGPAGAAAGAVTNEDVAFKLSLGSTEKEAENTLHNFKCAGGLEGFMNP